MLKFKQDYICVLLVATLGLAFGTIPHWWTGDRAWVGDSDELAFYLPMGAESLRDHPLSISDPLTGKETYYQRLPVLPGIVVARLFGTGPFEIGLAWRIVGGIFIGLAWYGSVRIYWPPLGALVGSLYLLADPGVVSGQLGYHLAKQLLSPPTLDAPFVTVVNASLPQWRILNPVTSLPWWLLFLVLTAYAVREPKRTRSILAGISLGLLFYIYFYLWTTAVVGLVLAVIADRGRAKTFLTIGLVGLVVGLPSVLSSMHFRMVTGDEWLHRTDKFLTVDRFEELLIPRVTLVLIGLLAVWVYTRAREWLWLVAMAVAGFLLLNHTVVTRLQIENFHWNLAMGPVIALLTIMAIADVGEWILGQKWFRAIAVIMTVCVTISAFWLYVRAIDGVPESRIAREAIGRFRSAPPPQTLGSVAGDPVYQQLTAIQGAARPLSGYTAILSPIPDAEVDDRFALNAWLRGWDRERFEQTEIQMLAHMRWGYESRRPEVAAARLKARLAAYDSVVKDPNAAILRYQVTLVARTLEDSESVPEGWERCPALGWNVWRLPRPNQP